MRCDEIRDLILTDYMDTQMPRDQREAIEKHLSSCENCFDLALNVRKLTVQPFFGAQRNRISKDAVWKKVRAQIEAEHAPTVRTNPIGELLNRLKENFYIPKPAFALGLVIVVLLGVKIFFIAPKAEFQYVRQIVNQQEQFVGGDIFDMASDDSNGSYGTDIEEYFL